MSEYECPSCGTPVEIEYQWDWVVTSHPCASCGATLYLQLNESYDAETGEEDTWFTLEMT